MDPRDLLTGRVQSGGREPAPAKLRRVQDFVNTVDREHGGDVLDAPQGLAAWLAHRGLPGGEGRPSAAAVERALALREALRALLLANNGGPADPPPSEVLAAAGRRARLAPAFGPEARLVPDAAGVDAGLGHVVADAFVAMVDGSWQRLKACPRDACGWAFYDRSTANRGTWCSMRVCGNRVKAGAYYRRRRGPQAG